MTTARACQRVKDEAGHLGFSMVGVCPAVTPSGAQHLDDWLAAGYAGEMHYIGDRREAYQHPRFVLAGARSVVMVALSYQTTTPKDAGAAEGRISRYAWGSGDYHDVMRGKLRLLAEVLQELFPTATVRGVVDTAPLMERDFAVLAGLGWLGKNGLLLNRQLGSWFFLGALVTDVELTYDTPTTIDHCGSCRACLDACPTDAFVEAYRLDPRRCISYLTIELKQPIPTDLRQDVGDWVFGCDVCQEVCPWNSDVPVTEETAFQPLANANPLELHQLFSLDDASFHQRFRRSPLWRPRRRGLLRNAAIVLGNHPQPSSLAALQRGLHDDEVLVRGACAWAIGRHCTPAARTALLERLEVEQDPEVAEEIMAALTDLDSALTA